jgi:hypothetical protein
MAEGHREAARSVLERDKRGAEVKKSRRARQKEG